MQPTNGWRRQTGHASGHGPRLHIAHRQRVGHLFYSIHHSASTPSSTANTLLDGSAQVTNGGNTSSTRRLRMRILPGLSGALMGSHGGSVVHTCTRPAHPHRYRYRYRMPPPRRGYRGTAIAHLGKAGRGGRAYHDRPTSSVRKSTPAPVQVRIRCCCIAQEGQSQRPRMPSPSPIRCPLSPRPPFSGRPSPCVALVPSCSGGAQLRSVQERQPTEP